jgi:hypothetical protein
LRYIEQESDIAERGLIVGDKLDRVTGILGWTALTDTAVATRDIALRKANH